jgi:Flp pilus assembly protein TadD
VLVKIPLGRGIALLSLVVSLQISAADKPTVSPSVDDRLHAARLHIQAQRWAAAKAELLIAAREEPNNADTHNLLGYTFRKQERPELANAFAHYKRALQLDPKHKGAHEYVGEAYLMDNNPTAAERHLAELEKLCGNKTCEEYVDLAAAIAAFKARK